MVSQTVNTKVGTAASTSVEELYVSEIQHRGHEERKLDYISLLKILSADYLDSLWKNCTRTPLLLFSESKRE